MGKHRAPEPKKLSFIASSSGLLGGVVLIVGLLATGGLISSDNPEALKPPATYIPEVIERDRNGSQPSQPGSQPSNRPTADSEQPPARTPVRATRPQPDRETEPPDTSTPEPPLVPLPPISEPVPPIRGDVQVEDVADVDLDVDLRRGVDIDLDAELNLESVTDTVSDLLNKITGE